MIYMDQGGREGEQTAATGAQGGGAVNVQRIQVSLGRDTGGFDGSGEVREAVSHPS